MAKRNTFKTLKDGVYLARCRESSLLAAASNGHSIIWPEGKKVWSCNMTYAANNFDVRALAE
ncbi:hypothetical protein NR803_035210 (plasmid) [Pseudomonas aeruginosa]|uniref:hypothetical protein n=1 Tax=Pseudomonas TaxID=286 RepID=UPI00081132D6|nr:MULTISPECIES: hypothetical protein [Pseudomonas]UZG81267.1 hypothetical protein NR803_035210 [Pseudomonas aeruginosa]WBW52328.1 hypothetical protein IGGMDNGE_00404 [Pseudomonas aeruginosa]WKA38636.1 hypothetical protein QYE79_34415 [Pseudomonas aeruginosa]